MSEVKTIQTELAQLLGDLAKTATSSTAVEPTPSDNSGITTTPTPTVEPAPVVPNVVPPVVTPEPVAIVAKPDNLETIVEAWDEDASGTAPTVPSATQPATTSAPSFDFSKMANVLGKEIKTEDELVTTISDLKKVVDSYSQEKTSIPQDLAKAIEIAKLQGNYLEYLNVSSVDWNKQDPVEVFENYIIDRATDASGNVDYEKVDAYLDKIDDFEKEVKGRELILNYVNAQKQVQAQIEAKAVEEKRQREQGLRVALDSVSDINGFKLSPTHKEEIFNAFVSGNAIKNMFYDGAGKLDFNKVVKALFITKYWDKVDNFRKQQVRNAAKREILENLTQPSLSTASSVVNPAPSKNGYSLDDYVADLKKQKGF